MKKLISILASIFLFACSNPQSISGPQGIQGKPGLNGADGKDGESGPQGIPGPASGHIYKQGNRLKPVYDTFKYSDNTEFLIKKDHVYYDSNFLVTCHDGLDQNLNYCFPDDFLYCTKDQGLNFYEDSECKIKKILTHSINFGGDENKDFCHIFIDKNSLYQCSFYHSTPIDVYYIENNQCSFNTKQIEVYACDSIQPVSDDIFVKFDVIYNNSNP